jgi:hypothetical protein
MKVYIVGKHHHYDDYKRAESYSDIEKVYKNEEDAHRYAVGQIILDSLINARFNYVNDEETDDEIEKCVHDFNYEGTCRECGGIEMTRAKIEDILNDESKTYKERYTWVDNNFSKIFGEVGEFTMRPTHTFYYVKCLEVE